MATLARVVQLDSSPLPTALGGTVKLVRAVQPANTRSPRFVVVLGSVMPVKVVEPRNTRLPTAVTGKPLMALGMTTAPPGPV